MQGCTFQSTYETVGYSDKSISYPLSNIPCQTDWKMPTQSQCFQVKTHTYYCNLVKQSNKCTSNLRAVGQRETLQPPGLSVRGTFPTGKMTNMYVPFGHPCLCFRAVKNRLTLLKALPFLLSTHYQSACHV